ncbi:MAG: hypothetical protein R3Y11_07960 [Pseudomonadota bacterium]
MMFMKTIFAVDAISIRKKYSTLCAVALVAVLVCLMFAFGCGKKAMPTPQDSSEEFYWKNAVASYHNGCLNISAELTGNVSNLDGIVLQVQAMTSDNSCQGCPFLPEEEQTYEYRDIALPGNGNNIAMNFCPKTKAAAYQWRLIGRNVIRTMPYMTTNVELIVPEENQQNNDFMPFIMQD